MSSKFDDSANFSPAPGFDVRFMRAFSNGMAKTSDKRTIAEILGYESDKAVYKIIKGDQEMNFERLLRFREATGYPIDWLLAGDYVPNHDDWVGIRFLLGRHALSEIEAMWRDRAEGRDAFDFHSFLQEIFEAGIQALRGEEKQPDILTKEEIIDLIRSVVSEMEAGRDGERSVDSNALGPLKKPDTMLARNLGKVGEEPAEERKRKVR